MTEYHEANKDEISGNTTSYSEEHNITEYHWDYYASDSELSCGLSSKIYHHKAPEKNCRESTAQFNCYHKAPKKSCIESTVWFKAYYHMDSEKSQIKSTAQSKVCIYIL